LAISVPSLLVLITLAFGLVSYLLITSRWETFESRGMDNLAAELLEGHLIAMIVLVVFSAIGGLAIVATVLRPIRAMEATARDIIQGRLDQRVPTIRSGDELGSLSRSFNSMIDFLNDCIEDRNRYMVEGIMTGLLLVDLDGRIKALNSTGAKLLGLESAWAIGRSLRELPKVDSRSDRTFWDEVDSALHGDLSRMTDETIVNATVGSAQLLVAMSVLRDSKKQPFGLMLNFRDAAEMRMLNEQLSKADQLAALGTFTMGLAHELRNPLGSIKGMIQLLALETPKEGESREIIDRVVREVNRLDVFVRELLDFSQEAPAPPTEVDLADIIRGSLTQVRAQFESASQMTIEVDLPDLPHVVGEPDRLVQAFSNILRNAFESARPGSRVTVRAVRQGSDAHPGIVVHFHNTGSTIRANDLDKVFDPFFTTKEKGNGLGLAIAYQILTQNGATVSLDVGPDEVDFVVTFPVKTPDTSMASLPNRLLEIPEVKEHVSS
jgi:PAS domain S-box-containing protein